MKTRAQLILTDLRKNIFQFDFCYFTPQVDISLPNIINSLILSLQVIRHIDNMVITVAQQQQQIIKMMRSIS